MTRQVFLIAFALVAFGFTGCTNTDATSSEAKTTAAAPATAAKGAYRDGDKPDGRGKGPCAQDLVKHCGDVTFGGGRMRKCLEDNMAKLSEKCRSARFENGKIRPMGAKKTAVRTAKTPKGPRAGTDKKK